MLSACTLSIIETIFLPSVIIIDIVFIELPLTPKSQLPRLIAAYKREVYVHSFLPDVFCVFVIPFYPAAVLTV